jgi:hypothetical protein
MASPPREGRRIARRTAVAEGLQIVVEEDHHTLLDLVDREDILPLDEAEVEDNRHVVEDRNHPVDPEEDTLLPKVVDPEGDRRTSVDVL